MFFRKSRKPVNCGESDTDSRVISIDVNDIVSIPSSYTISEKDLKTIQAFTSELVSTVSHFNMDEVEGRLEDMLERAKKDSEG